MRTRSSTHTHTHTHAHLLSLSLSHSLYCSKREKPQIKGPPVLYRELSPAGTVRLVEDIFSHENRETLSVFVPSLGVLSLSSHVTPVSLTFWLVTTSWGWPEKHTPSSSGTQF